MRKVSLVVLALVLASFAFANCGKCETTTHATKMKKAECMVSTADMKTCMEKCGTKCCKECKACSAMKTMATDCKDCPGCQGKKGKALVKAKKACMEKMKADCAVGCTDKKCKAECCKKDKK